MAEIERTIMRELEDDGTIVAKDVGVEVVGGVFRKRKTLRLYGTVRSEAEKRKVAQVAAHHAGDRFDLKDDLAVKA